MSVFMRRADGSGEEWQLTDEQVDLAGRGLAGRDAAAGQRGIDSLPEERLSRLCRIHLGRLLAERPGDEPDEALSLTLALRFIEMRMAVEVAGMLREEGVPCALYHGRLKPSEKARQLETQFFLKTSSRVTGRDVRYVFQALWARARRLRHRADPGGRVELWVQADDPFVEEADGVLERLENRTRAFGLCPLKDTLEDARAGLPPGPSPATRHVLDYLYDPMRPRQISILDIAEEAALAPAQAFREVQTLTRLGLIGQDLSFDVTLARGVPRFEPGFLDSREVLAGGGGHPVEGRDPWG